MATALSAGLPSQAMKCTSPCDAETSPCSGPAYRWQPYRPGAQRRRPASWRRRRIRRPVDEGDALSLLAATGAVEEPAASRIAAHGLVALVPCTTPATCKPELKSSCRPIRGARAALGRTATGRVDAHLADVVHAHVDAVHVDKGDRLGKQANVVLPPGSGSAETAAGANPIRKARPIPATSFHKLRSACIDNSSGLNNPVPGGGDAAAQADRGQKFTSRPNRMVRAPVTNGLFDVP